MRALVQRPRGPVGRKMLLMLEAPLHKSECGLIVREGHILPPKMASETSITPYTLFSKE